MISSLHKDYISGRASNSHDTDQVLKNEQCRKVPLISLLSINFRGGGVQISMLRKARRLMAMGFEVEMLVFERDGPLLDYYGDDIPVVELAPGSALLGRWLAVQADPGGIRDYLRPVLLAHRPPHRLGFLSSLARHLRENRPDALITAGSGSNILAVWARRLAGVSTRIIVSQRDIISESVNNDRHWRRRFLAPALRRTYAMADAVVAVSRGVAEDLTSTTGLSREAISVIYNPVVDDKFVQLASAPLDHPWFRTGEPPVLLAVGRLAPQKDYPTLIEAFAGVRAKRVARLLILGDGKDAEDTARKRAALMQIAARKNVADDLELAGFAANPAAYMARAALLVLCSRHEGLGNVLIEALACGCPVVSTDCPHGPAEILDQGLYGRLVPVGDSEALAAAILATLDEPPDRERLRVRGAEFTVERAVDAYLDLLFPGSHAGPWPALPAASSSPEGVGR
jgi:glycosyltransferase involved in cell wall biosynthesis